jgi:hypothetical protein
MSRQIELQNVAAVLYDYWPDDYNRVRSALEAIVHYEPCDDTNEADVNFLDHSNGNSGSAESN